MQNSMTIYYFCFQLYICEYVSFIINISFLFCTECFITGEADELRVTALLVISIADPITVPLSCFVKFSTPFLSV